MALYRSSLTVTLWPSSFLKKYGPMIPPAHKAHQTMLLNAEGSIRPITPTLPHQAFQRPGHPESRFRFETHFSISRNRPPNPPEIPLCSTPPKACLWLAHPLFLETKGD
ncbi:hypothetical protein TNCV_2979121 [Trichonephila clavipes]|nr:hypothetical protein TNCV_2979121 [Trichonephila clavipes]